MRFDRTLGICLLMTAAAWARYPAAVVKDYAGRHQEDYTVGYDRVRLLAKQAQIEASARLGLIQYREGFQYPLLIRFDDGAPAGAENALAYVALMEANGAFAQQLVINLEMPTHTEQEFDRVFTHEMTHAVLNDAVGGEASQKIPAWVQEGLAQYVSGEGPDRVIEEAQTVRRSQAQSLLAELDGPASGAAYAQYFLAIETIREKHSVNAVEALVRNLIVGKPIADAVEDATGLKWEKFQAEVREYSLKVFQDKARSDF